MKILFLPFILQAVLMAVDERIHTKRNLSLWERIGHPLDTFTVVIAFTFLALAPHTTFNLGIYIFLCIISCLFITKDEWVHQKECSPLEQWLHSVLFMLHPLVFVSAGIMWRKGYGEIFLGVLPFFVSLFMLFQIVRWSFYAKSKTNR